MALKVKTLALQDATSKAIKGVGKVGMLAITTAICIEAKDGLLTLSTTNNVNNVEVRIKLDEFSEDFYACTDAEIFSKLVAKTDSEFIELSIEDSALQFVGAGAYNLSLIQDEEGNMGRITPIVLNSSANKFKLLKDDLFNILTYNKLSVAKTFEEILYTNYFINNNKCITFDTVTACNSNIKLNSDVKALLPASIVSLLSVYTEPEVDVTIDEDKIIFETPMIKVSGMLCDGIENYPVEPLLELFNNEEYNKTIKVNTGILRSCLDRLSLFTSENSDIVLNFTKESLIIQSKDSNACEEIPYIEPVDIDEYSNTCDINDFQPIVSAANVDNISIIFGYSQGFKVAFNDVDYIIPFANDSEDVEVSE